MSTDLCGACYQPIDEDDEDVYECQSCEQALCRECFRHQPLCDGCAGDEPDEEESEASEASEESDASDASE